MRYAFPSFLSCETKREKKQQYLKRIPLWYKEKIAIGFSPKEQNDQKGKKWQPRDTDPWAAWKVIRTSGHHPLLRDSFLVFFSSQTKKRNRQTLLCDDDVCLPFRFWLIVYSCLTTSWFSVDFLFCWGKSHDQTKIFAHYQFLQLPGCCFMLLCIIVCSCRRWKRTTCLTRDKNLFLVLQVNQNVTVVVSNDTLCVFEVINCSCNCYCLFLSLFLSITRSQRHLHFLITFLPSFAWHSIDFSVPFLLNVSHVVRWRKWRVSSCL